ncbi:hypothetical protein D3C87_113270 [compost metagenome]
MAKVYLLILLIFLTVPCFPIFYDHIQAICIFIVFILSIKNYRKNIYYFDNLFWIGAILYLFFYDPSLRFNREIYDFSKLYLALTFLNFLKFRTVFLPISLSSFLLKGVFALHLLGKLLDSRSYFYYELKIIAIVYLFYTLFTIVFYKVACHDRNKNILQ